MKKKPLHLLRLKGLPIYQQLQIEEALLRNHEHNWCIINEGTPPAIVMGISGKVEHLIDRELILRKPLPVIRRFSGGGTVVVDDSTYFVTWIFNSHSIEIPPFPDSVLQWTIQFYRQAFPELNIELRENDYVIGNRKCGGNAQYLRKDRWLHHSSLLWNFQHENMKYLLMPQKMPNYRQQRQHGDFLCKFADYFPTKESVQKCLEEAIQSRFTILEEEYETVLKLLQHPHRKSVEMVEIKKDC